MNPFDVIVVGKGNAALCAALSARAEEWRRDSVTLCGRVRERRRTPVLEPTEAIHERSE